MKQENWLNILQLDCKFNGAMNLVKQESETNVQLQCIGFTNMFQIGVLKSKVSKVQAYYQSSDLCVFRKTSNFVSIILK